MCYQCERGLPHHCSESGSFELGGHSLAKGAFYREERPRLLGQGQREVLHDGDDPGEDPLAHLTIKTTAGHIISTGTHLPGDATRRDVDDQDAILAETMLTAGPRSS